ncbi:MAG: alpha/beta hydrolase-fold protein [Verrucomicrobiota bacterium]
MKSFALLLLFALAVSSAPAQDNKKKKAKKEPPPFAWVNEVKWAPPKGVRHETFKSPSMGIDVGYCIYLPEEYGKKSNLEREYPVVYHLHGGRPGSEWKSVRLATFVDEAIRSGKIEPKIYVFPNGGPMSWYNYPKLGDKAYGEDVFVKELIPHIDQRYRVSSRHIEGFSQGGRGTTRIMLKYPELFRTAAPGGSGYEPEKRIQENDGAESENVVFAKGYNTWDLADEYAQREPLPKLPIMLWVGTKGFNYEFNLKYSENLKELGIPHELLVAEGVDHSATRYYEKRGLELMKFHQR